MNFNTSWIKSLFPNDEPDYVSRQIAMPTTNIDNSDSTYAPLSNIWPFFCDENDTWCLLNDTSGASNSTVEVITEMTTGNTTSNSTLDNFTGIDYRYWNLILLIFPLFTVFGNVLVVMSVVRERQLKTATNYFICSLAVADIMVAVVVMPPAVYLEVVQSWLLSDALCDAWVASDVMACTASILNLTAISVDRFIAVTQPIKYSKHKNSKRVFVTLALTWVISLSIAAPIALGVNYSEYRQKGDCTFFNSDFLIYSSMGSFYIPSIIMMFLYWRIYRVLRMRAKAIRNKKAKTGNVTVTNVIENTATINATQTEPTIKTGLAKSIDNGKISTYNTNKSPNQLLIPVCEDNVSNMATNTDSSERFMEDDSKSPESADDQDDKEADFIVNPVAVRHVEIQIDGNGNGTCNVDTQLETETKFSSTPSSERRTKGNPEMEHKCQLISANDTRAGTSRRKEKRTVGKYFHRRTSRKRKEKSSSKREKKATKTLAIVLGVFLFCWVPFFTINITNAICIKFKEELSEYSICQPNMTLLSVLVWLGYINSFLNPVIYTIFNPEFRKAFKKILSECCCK